MTRYHSDVIDRALCKVDKIDLISKIETIY